MNIKYDLNRHCHFERFDCYYYSSQSFRIESILEDAVDRVLFSSRSLVHCCYIVGRMLRPTMLYDEEKKIGRERGGVSECPEITYISINRFPCISKP